MRKSYYILAVSAVILVWCLSFPRATKAVPISDENEHALAGVFDGLQPKPFLSHAPGILKAAQQKSCGRKTQHLATMERVVSWTSPTTVFAQACPDCFHSTDKCGGQYIFLQSQAYIHGCTTSGYNKAYSMPGLAQPWNGWCYSGAAVCGECQQCDERNCYLG